MCRKTGIDVAIKMVSGCWVEKAPFNVSGGFQIDKKLMQAEGMVGRVQQEVSIHSRLKHPAILELYTFFEDANYVYLILELCHNGELQQYIKRKVVKKRAFGGSCLSLVLFQRLTESQVSNVMRQVVEGIKYLHFHSILHRDISLSNLLITKDMQVVSTFL